MSKVLRCRDVGLNCDFVAHGETEQEILAKTAEHAKKDHGMEHIPDEVLTKVKHAIHDE